MSCGARVNVQIHARLVHSDYEVVGLRVDASTIAFVGGPNGCVCVWVFGRVAYW